MNIALKDYKFEGFLPKNQNTGLETGNRQLDTEHKTVNSSARLQESLNLLFLLLLELLILHCLLMEGSAFLPLN